MKRPVITPSNGAVTCSKLVSCTQPVHRRLLRHYIGPRDRKCRRSRGEGQPVLITLLRT